jgi:Tfp pilus assembly protein FimT
VTKTKALSARLHRRGASARAVAGYSILELVAVIAIITIMVAVSVMSLPANQRALAVDNAGAQMVDVLRYAQQKALSDRQMMRVELTPGTSSTPGTIIVVDQNTISLGSADDVTIRSETLASNSDSTVSQTLSGMPYPPSPYNFLVAPFASNTLKIYFSSDGSINAVNGAGAATPLSFTLIYFTPLPNGSPDPQSTRAITAFGPTGSIKVWRYDPASSQFKES